MGILGTLERLNVETSGQFSAGATAHSTFSEGQT